MFDLLVLAHLALRPSYGYELKKILSKFKLNNNTIYPMLKKFVDSGYVMKETVVQEDNPPKKIYSITDKGIEKLMELIKDYDQEKAGDSDAFYIRVSFFPMLEKEDIAHILSVREYSLRNFANVQLIRDSGENPHGVVTDTKRLQEHILHITDEQLVFIDELKKQYGIV